jgi:hypothetical protein
VCRFYTAVPILIGIAFITIVLKVTVNHTPNTNTLLDPHTRWQSQNIQDYQMTIIVNALPAPPAALDLVIRNGEIVAETILACEQPSEEYPERWCEPTRDYYAYMARLTIDDLFETAEQCLEQTRLALSECPYIAADFQGFEDKEEMYQAAESCQTYLRGSPDTLCAVQYNDVYGNPQEISLYFSNTFHPRGAISVRDFQPEG